MNNTIMQNDNQEQPVEKKKRIPWIIAGLLLVILLVGAAFIGGSLLNKSADPSADMTLPEFTPADEMPKEEPELIGLVSSLEGDTLTVQEFNMYDTQYDTQGMAGEGGVFDSEIAVSEEDMESGNVSIADFIGADGPVTEVVITHDTKIYKDKTNEQFGGYIEMEGNEMPEMPDKIEQKVEPGTADEIGTNATVTIWGERRGDRVIATFILFQPAMDFGGGEYDFPD